MTSRGPVIRAECDDLSFMEGARLVDVTYHYLPPADAVSYAGGEEGVDADLSAVVLHLGERGTATITWAMLSDLEGLAVVRQEPYQGRASRILEAKGREAWRNYIGKDIARVVPSWQSSGNHLPESLWALRLEFDSGSIVIALGTAGTVIEYIPDELVVIFDATTARSYRPSHVPRSSWGAVEGEQ